MCIRDRIKAEYRNAPDGVPVSSNQWFLYSDDFIGFLKQSKELGDQRTDVTYMERTGVSDMYEVIQWPNKLIGNISTGTMVWEQDFILYRYAHEENTEDGKLTSFPDAKDISGYALEAMNWAVARGLINGSDGKLLPQDTATRAQIAVILARYLNA